MANINISNLSDADLGNNSASFIVDVTDDMDNIVGGQSIEIGKTITKVVTGIITIFSKLNIPIATGSLT